MSKRVRPEGLSEQEHRSWLEAFKNRAKHSVKLPDPLERDYQQWKQQSQIGSDNAALRYLISTHPELQSTSPTNSNSSNV